MILKVLNLSEKVKIDNVNAEKQCEIVKETVKEKRYAKVPQSKFQDYTTISKLEFISKRKQARNCRGMNYNITSVAIKDAKVKIMDNR